MRQSANQPASQRLVAEKTIRPATLLHKKCKQKNVWLVYSVYSHESLHLVVILHHTLMVDVRATLWTCYEKLAYALG